MKTLFAKYNSERLPKYQIVTKIVHDCNGKHFAVKEPLLDEAKDHIDTIFHNYELLTSRYSINLVQPTKQGNTVVFEMAKGVSLEKLMLQAIHDGDAELFERYVEKFVAYVDQFVSHKNVLFESSDQFKAVFGEWTIDEPQDIIDLANIDLIFGNIFLRNDDFTLIDYEWVFEFPIPKSYIIWRTLYIFSIYHEINISKYAIEHFFKYHNEYAQMDEEFSSYVHGKNKEHFLNQKVLKANIPLNIQQTISINQADSFIQLFLDQGNGITEENSIKLPVAENTQIQEFVFELTNKFNITSLRLDPLNESCVIEIESLRLIKEDSEIDLTSFIQANNCMHNGKSYFFDTIDPIIHFSSVDFSGAQKFIATIRYPHIGRDALAVIAKQSKTELDQIKVELEQILLVKGHVFIDLIKKNKKNFTIALVKFKSDIKQIKKSGLFDFKYYQKNNSDVLMAGVDPLKHFIIEGWKEGRNPSAEFDINFYLQTHPDVTSAGINPLVHYIKYGQKEGRKTNISDPSTLQPTKVSKLNQLISLGKHAKNNPHLIGRAVNEVRIHGIKKTITKIKNKSHKLETFMTALQGSTDFKEILSLFHESPNIPNLKVTKPIDILIPVYNGKEYLIPLFQSIFTNTSLPYRLVVCDDKSSDATVLPLLNTIKNTNPTVNMIILENAENLGFVKTVNKLAKLAENHFVLLNTDTEVPPYWIERLMYPIFEMKNIASTTPFTNAGTICSFPSYLEDNPIFENMNVNEIDKQFQFVNFDTSTIELPTGVGFCMGVNKTLVDNIGMFDEIFGKGYGEENDWCQRAIEQGYKNLHVTNLFVYHKHGGSFPNEEKQRLIQTNLRILNKKHPTYDEQVQSIVAKNELSLLREILEYKTKNNNLSSVLIFDHNLSGGAHDYIEEDIIKRVSASQVVCLIRYDFNITKKYIVKLITNKQEIKLQTPDLNEIIKFLKQMQFDEIFVNSLVMYPDIENIIGLISDIKKHTSSKVIVPIHDFFPVCPSYTLLDETMTYCGVPNDDERCNRCLANNKGEFRIFEKETNIRQWRNTWQKLFEQSDEILCFSHSSKSIFSKAYPVFDDKIQVIPHDISGRYQKIYDETIRSDKIIIGVLGSINDAKGAKVIENLVKHIDKHKIDTKVVLIGQISIPIASSSFEVTGRYEKQDLPQIVKKLNISKFLIPSICPETFSYTTDEIIQMGYPLVVFNLGAPAERVKDYPLGKVIEIQDLNEVLFEK